MAKSVVSAGSAGDAARVADGVGFPFLFLPPRYVSVSGLQTLENYKYASGLSSFIDTNIMNPFWTFVVSLLPMWLAPNLLTTLSLMFGTLTFYLLVVLWGADLFGTAPSWAYFASALFMFLYQTLDAVDGKQARRTGSSSPLGQLFDHGCDSICATMTGAFIASSTSCGPSMVSFIIMLIAIVPFFIANWEESCTGYMRFGLLGVTEGQFIIMGLLTLTGMFGPSWWLSALFQFQEFIITPRHILIGTAAIGFFYQVITSLFYVYKHYQSHPEESSAQARRALIQFVVYLLFSWIWVASPYSIYTEFPRIHLTCIGSLMSYQVTRLIICHVTGDEFPAVLTLLYPLPFVALNGMGGVYLCSPYFAMLMYAVYIVISYLHFIHLTITQITRYLGIRCFIITPKKEL